MTIKKILFIFLSIFLLILISLQFAIISTAIREQPEKSDAIIVLGCQLWGDKPSPMLKYRLEKTLELYNSGYGNTIIVSGAQGDDELTTEAFAMKKFLVQNGIPQNNILEEDNSYNTYQNLYYSNEIMEDNNFGSAIIVTNSFHIHRALMIANRLNMDVSAGVAQSYPNLALTAKFYFREVLAYVKDFIRIKQIA